MPDYAAVGPVKQDQRRVVDSHIAWHRDSFSGMKRPYAADVTKVLAGDPDVRDWTPSIRCGRRAPITGANRKCGYFLSKDEYVIRKDMSMLADAGVDVLVMDVTNAVRYWDEWDVMFPVMQKMKAEGNKVPHVLFLGLQRAGDHRSAGLV